MIKTLRAKKIMRFIMTNSCSGADYVNHKMRITEGELWDPRISESWMKS